MQHKITIQHNKIENNIVTYKKYCNTKTQHNKEKKHYNVQKNMIVLQTNIVRHKTML